jgi:hypothetical protein
MGRRETIAVQMSRRGHAYIALIMLGPRVCGLAGGAKEIRTLRPTLNASVPRAAHVGPAHRSRFRSRALLRSATVLRDLGHGTGRADAFFLWGSNAHIPIAPDGRGQHGGGVSTPRNCGGVGPRFACDRIFFKISERTAPGPEPEATPPTPLMGHQWAGERNASDSAEMTIEHTSSFRASPVESWNKTRNMVDLVWRSADRFASDDCHLSRNPQS